VFQKKPIYINFDTTDSDFGFILGSNNEINPTSVNRIDSYPTGLGSQVVLEPSETFYRPVAP